MKGDGDGEDNREHPEFLYKKGLSFNSKSLHA